MSLLFSLLSNDMECKNKRILNSLFGVFGLFIVLFYFILVSCFFLSYFKLVILII